MALNINEKIKNMFIKNSFSESTTDGYSANYVNQTINTKIGYERVHLDNGGTQTFTVTTRGTYIVTTTSNSGGIKSCYLILTGNSTPTVVNLGGSTGTQISITGSGTTLSVENQGAYGTEVTIITLTDS